MPWGGGGGASSTGQGVEFKPLTIGYAGDSISEQWSQENGQSPMFWFTTLFYPCSTINTFTTADPGTTSSDLLTNQIAPLEALATKPELLIVHTTQNDYIGDYTLAEASMANVSEYCDRALAAGVGNIILAGHPPKTGTDDPPALEYLNRSMAAYAGNTEGVHFIDVLTLWRERPTGEDAADSGIDWMTAYSDDGTHPTSYAMYQVGKLLEPIIAPLVQLKDVQPTTASKYNDVTKPYSNLLQLNGLLLGTSGKYNGVTNANVAGVSSNNLDHWEVTDEDGIVATPSIVVGDDGYNYQQIVLSGTATGTADIYIKFGFALNPVTLGDFVQEAFLELDDITGVNFIRFGTDNINQFDIMSSNQELAGENRLHLTSERSYFSDGYSTRTFIVRIRVLSGESPTGTIQLGRVGVYRQVD